MKGAIRPPRRHTIVPVMVAASSCAGLVILCVLSVDRPAATLAHAAFSGHDGVFRALTHIVDPLLPSSVLGIAVAGAAALCGWRPGRIAHLAIACGFAVLVSYAVKEQLKFDFGRLWPETWIDNNPSWIGNGAYGFFPFHGRIGWSSFPSGHMTSIMAPVAVLWVALPRWKPVLCCPGLLVAIGLYGADFHFIGDMVAGSFLGAACGVGVLAALRDPQYRTTAPDADPGRGARMRAGAGWPDGREGGVPDEHLPHRKQSDEPYLARTPAPRRS